VLFLVVLGSAAAPLLSGHLAPLFWGGLVVLGLVIPLLLDLLGGLRIPAVVPAALVLLGGFILRYVVVMTHA
jgi:formate-dependent nitrite reductase membrane component NrfD